MGCANSKESKFRRYKNNDSASPMRRSITLYPRSHLEGGGDGASHVSARTSAALMHEDSFIDATRQGLKGTTLGEQFVREKSGFEEKTKDQLAVGLDEAKIWSNLMEERIPKIVPKTPVRTPPGEPENINLWELMEGLEDTSPIIKSDAHNSKSFSFDVACEAEPVHVSSPIGSPKSIFNVSVKKSHETCELAQNGFSHLSGADSPEGPENCLSCTEPENERSLPNKPKWLDMSSDEKASVPEFDPEMISMFRKSMEDLSPENRFYIRPRAPPTPGDGDEQWQALATKNTFQSSKKDRVVVYFTSLRGIRKTYEDCCHVRVILKGLRVRVDEKDLSMHLGFKDELKQLLGDTYGGGGGLPRVFIGKKYVGGADEIRRLHEEGELEKLVEGCEKVDISGNRGNASCEACGDIRFIPCETCSGSCKIFYDYDEDEERAEDLEDDGFGFHRCPDCNENGLIRCPLCCD